MESKTYEGLFLIDPIRASQDFDAVKKQIVELIERRSGTILNAKKWGERKLAYEIKGHKRGTYLLIYFQIPAQNVSTLRRDIQLSELVLRNMILVYDKPIPQDTNEPVHNDTERKDEEQNINS